MVTNPHESIRLFALCGAMQFNHLPVAGGIYDQHPELIARWEEIFSAQAKHDRQKHAEEESKANNIRRRRGK